MKVPLRRCFIGVATRSTIKKVLEFGLFASNLPVFQEVERGDIGFLILLEDRNGKLKPTKIIGIFEAVSSQYKDPGEPFNKFPYRVKVKRLVEVEKEWKQLEEEYPHIAFEIRKGSKGDKGWSYVFTLDVTKELLRFFGVDFEETTEEPIIKTYRLGFEDIIGFEKVKKYVLDRIPPDEKDKWLKWQENSEKLGLKQRYGIFLFGPPGTGKTLFATALSKEIGGVMYEIKADMIIGYPGEAEARFVNLFNRLLREPRAVLFIDEAEWILGKRDRQTSSVMMRVIPTVLSLLTKAFKKRGRSMLFIVASTNNPAAIDEAFLRPGRFGKVFYVPPPNRTHLEGLLKYMLKGKYGGIGGNMSDEEAKIVIDYLLEKRDSEYENFYYSGADIEAFVEEAKINALKDGRGYITSDDLLQALDSVRPTISNETTNNMREFCESWKAEVAHEGETC